MATTPQPATRTHTMKIEGDSMEELRELSQARDKAAEKIARVLKEDGKTAENMEDYWKCQQSGQEPC